MSRGKEIIQIPYGAEVSKEIWGNAQTGQEVLDNLLEYVFEQLVTMYGKSRAGLMWYEDAVDAYVKYYVAPWLGELKKQKKVPKWIEIEVRKRPRRGSRDGDIDSVEEAGVMGRGKRKLFGASYFDEGRRIRCARCKEEIDEKDIYRDEEGREFCRGCSEKLLDFGTSLYVNEEDEFEESVDVDFSVYRIMFDGMVITNEEDDVRRETENPRLAVEYVKQRKALGAKRVRRSVLLSYPAIVKEVYDTPFDKYVWYWIFAYDRLLIIKEGGTDKKVRDFVSKVVYPKLDRKQHRFRDVGEGE